jgi:hypothetical protein
MVFPPFLIRVMRGPAPVCFRSGGLTGTANMLLLHFIYSNREHVMNKTSHLFIAPFFGLVFQVLKAEPKGQKEWRQRRICFS